MGSFIKACSNNNVSSFVFDSWVIGMYVYLVDGLTVKEHRLDVGAVILPLPGKIGKWDLQMV